MTTTPDIAEARRLADQLKERYGAMVPTSQSAAMLRALADELERLRQAAELDLRDDVIESLKGDLAQERALCEERGRRLDEQGEELERLRAQVAPAGWKLVPVEPTPEMIAAWPNNRHGSGHEAAIYRAMLAAAPAVEKDHAEFEVWEGDELFASTSGPRAQAWTELLRYADQCYGAGIVRVFEVSRVELTVGESDVPVQDKEPTND